MFRHYRSISLLTLSCLLFITTSTVTISQSDTINRDVWVFYLSFWAGDNTWEWNETVLTDRPAIGYYNSKLPDVVDTQIQQAMNTGIDAFIVNWWGIDEAITTSPALINMLDRAQYNNFEIAVAIDLYPQEFFQTRDQLERSLTWLYDEVIDHPAYLHYNGKPIIFYAFQDRFDRATWQELRESIDPNHDVIWIAGGLNACCLYGGVMDGMYAFNMAWANGVTDYYIAERNLIYDRGGEIYFPTISPGWDEDAIATITNRPNPTSPRDRADGQFLTDSWNGVMPLESDVVLIVSWNEFIENSHIEPSEVYGTQSLDVLRPLITEWTGEQPNQQTQLPDNYVVVVRDSVDAPLVVYTEPNRQASIIGELTPDTQYTLIDEDNGLYAIDFNGQIGYVAWEQVRILGE